MQPLQRTSLLAASACKMGGTRGSCDKPVTGNRELRLPEDFCVVFRLDYASTVAPGCVADCY